MPRITKPKLCPIPVDIAAALLTAPSSPTPSRPIQDAYAALYYTAINQGLRIPLTM